MAHWEPLEESRLEDAINIQLRQADKDELRAGQGDIDSRQVLSESINISTERYIIVDDDGSVIGVFGVAVNGPYAHPWLLAKEQLDKHSRQFIRECRPIVDRWAMQYPILCNYVSSKNEVCHRWLRWLGFDIHSENPVILGDPEVPFYPFYMMRSYFDV